MIFGGAELIKEPSDPGRFCWNVLISSFFSNPAVEMGTVDVVVVETEEKVLVVGAIGLETNEVSRETILMVLACDLIGSLFS